MSAPTGRPAPDAPAKRPNRQVDIAHAAIEVFWRKGYASASIQDIADRVGMLKGSLYHYIDSKEDLLWAIVDLVHRRSTLILADVRALDVPALQRLHTYIERHARWYLDDPREVMVFLREWRNLTGERRALANERRHGYDRSMRALIGDAQAEGSIDAGIPAAYAARYLLAALSAMPDWYRPDGADPPERIAEAYADLTIGMLTAARHDRVAPRGRRAA